MIEPRLDVGDEAIFELDFWVQRREERQALRRKSGANVRRGVVAEAEIMIALNALDFGCD